MRTNIIGGVVIAGVVALAIGGCGSSGSTTSPSPSPSPSPPPGGGSTVTITNNTVSPTNITVTRGSQVTFTNNDSRPHDIASNPHPEHTDCPEINQVGFVNPGQSRQTGNLNTARTCGYHDHNQPDVRTLQGTITIQ